MYWDWSWRRLPHNWHCIWSRFYFVWCKFLWETWVEFTIRNWQPSRWDIFHQSKQPTSYDRFDDYTWPTVYWSWWEEHRRRWYRLSSLRWRSAVTFRGLWERFPIFTNKFLKPSLLDWVWLGIREWVIWKVDIQRSCSYYDVLNYV